MRGWLSRDVLVIVATSSAYTGIEEAVNEEWGRLGIRGPLCTSNIRQTAQTASRLGHPDMRSLRLTYLSVRVSSCQARSSYMSERPMVELTAAVEKCGKLGKVGGRAQVA